LLYIILTHHAQGFWAFMRLWYEMNRDLLAHAWCFLWGLCVSPSRSTETPHHCPAHARWTPGSGSGTLVIIVELARDWNWRCLDTRRQPALNYSETERISTKQRSWKCAETLFFTPRVVFALCGTRSFNLSPQQSDSATPWVSGISLSVQASRSFLSSAH